MSKEKNFILHLLVASVVVIILMIPGVKPSHVHAQEPTPPADHGTCIKCHENLYYLHDTGNWFCIRESPMRCVDCHGGDPAVIQKEAAHANRQAHPIINEDISKCQECHPAECPIRLAKFDQVAGISDVLVADAYTPAPDVRSERPLDMVAGEPGGNPAWLSVMEIIVLACIAGLALTLFAVHKLHHP